MYRHEILLELWTFPISGCLRSRVQLPHLTYLLLALLRIRPQLGNEYESQYPLQPKKETQNILI